MKAVILAAGCFLADDLTSFQAPPAWRKATRNMIMATASLERALDGLPLERLRDDMGLVVGSSSGELETSAEFLTTLSKTKVARPLLFQNSLHNATTGFASIHFRLTGPSFTVSSGCETPGEALRLARLLVGGGVCRACAVTLVEAHKNLAGLIRETPGEGACSLIAGDADFAAELGVKPLAALDDSWLQSKYPDQAQSAPLIDFPATPFFERVRGLI